MVIFKKTEAISALLHAKKEAGSSIGFVPTMGALHPGHLSLIESSLAENDLTVCSIFVNPTQFNNAEDFRHYPVTIEKDVEQLTLAGCDVLFLPLRDEVYPPTHLKKQYAIGDLEGLLEGYYRPGHFQGVCEVVDRLLEIVAPSRLYLGQKDFQQCMVIRRLLQLTGREQSVELRIGPTLREEGGLAMSSRNLRLSPEERQTALHINRVMQEIRAGSGSRSVDELKAFGRQQLEREGFRVDYVEIADAATLLPADGQTHEKVILVAASLNGIRLIDNLLLN